MSLPPIDATSSASTPPAPDLSATPILGYPVHPVTAEQGLSVVRRAWEDHQNCHVITLNPEMIMQAEANPELGRILKASQLNLPDGAGVVWALKRRGVRSVRRLPGIEFAEQVLAEAARLGLPVSLIGAKDTVLMAAIENLKSRYPGLTVSYAHHGYFQDGPEADAIAQACADAAPRVVLVALGVPKQETWIARHAPRFAEGQGAVFIGVGGSLDVWSGQTVRAPYWFRKLNLEWLYRITSEPWRIKRVYKTLPLFVLKVLQNNR
jgi:N-acetylglucosaminyldiphosphoundecaprenol N-acetyl-beta-D-mannosaminyltransferase